MKLWDDLDTDDMPDGGEFTADLSSYNNYYAFGSLQPLRNYSSSSYRYGLQGQEKDDEIKGSGNSIEYKYRIYDPRLARFLSVDPLTNEYPWNSPYSFAENKVIQYVELEGLEVGEPGNNSYRAAALVISGSPHETQKRYKEENDATAEKIGYAPVVGLAAGAAMGLWGTRAILYYVGEEIAEELAGFPIIPDPGDAIQSIAKKQYREQPMPWVNYTPGRMSYGYSNPGKLESHLAKRKLQGYEFKDVDQMVNYGENFFKREGNNIFEFTDKQGYIHRLDEVTQEYGILTPDNKIQSVFKVESKANSTFHDGKSYMDEQKATWGTKDN
jgi:RHS repeat-associated protein